MITASLQETKLSNKRCTSTPTKHNDYAYMLSDFNKNRLFTNNKFSENDESGDVIQFTYYQIIMIVVSGQLDIFSHQLALV